jgi:hypothetical protein
LIQIPKVRIQATKSLIFKQVHPLTFLEAIGDIAVNEAHRNNEYASRRVFIGYVQRKPDLVLYESLFCYGMIRETDNYWQFQNLESRIG